MKTSTIVAALVGGVVMFGLGFLIYGLALDAYMKANMITYTNAAGGKLMKEMPDWIPLVISNLAWGWLIAYVFDQWAGIRTFVAGIIGGVMIILPAAIAIDTMFMAIMNLWSGGFVPVLVDIVAFTVMGAITGGVVGQVLGMMNKSAATD